MSMIHTDIYEFRDVVTTGLLLLLAGLCLFPCFLIYHLNLRQQSLFKETIQRLKVIAISITTIFLLLVTNGRFYASFFREHKELRCYANPIYFVYSTFKYVKESFKVTKAELTLIGTDAKIILNKKMDKDSRAKKKLLILVVGETARSDRFSLNGPIKQPDGKERVTNPLLAREEVISLRNVYSCGTSTAISVPCMFSATEQGSFSVEKANKTENLLDILKHTNEIALLWRDNNSDSKGVADRIAFEDYKQVTTNPICDFECRDVGMLEGLQNYIEQVKKNGNKNIVIVLHQMGNHGPAYFHRYPKNFQVFNPLCHSKELSECTNEEILNAYDNAILYTDYFLAQTIQLLKKNQKKYDTVLYYMSDHGESLGEKGIYLHGLPYMMAPDEQTKVGSIFWFGNPSTRQIAHKKLSLWSEVRTSHDNFFHTVLGIMNVDTEVYDPELDLLTTSPNQ